MKNEVILTVLGILGIFLLTISWFLRHLYLYPLTWMGAILAVSSLYLHHKEVVEQGKWAKEKLTVKNILPMLALTASGILLTGMILEIMISVLFYGEVLYVDFYFYLAISITIPCLLIALLVKKYRKKAVVPPMIACGLSAIIYLSVFHFLETLICLVFFAISYILYAYLS